MPRELCGRLNATPETSYLPRMAKKQLLINADELTAIQVSCSCGASSTYPVTGRFTTHKDMRCQACSKLYSEALLKALNSYRDFRVAYEQDGAEISFVVDVAD